MARKIVTLIVLASFLTVVTGCGETKVINGVEYDTYGLLNADSKKNPDIAYEPIWGNVFWGIVFSETIIVPVYVFGFSLYEPVGKTPAIKGAVPR